MVNCFKLSKCLLFAKNLKLFKSVKNVLDASDLQRDLDTLSTWCQRNRYFLILSFYRRRYPVKFDYMIVNSTINRVTIIRELGILFDQNMPKLFRCLVL